MPSPLARLFQFARSPQGKRAMRKAQSYASSPEGKAKIAQAREKLAKRGGRKQVR